MICGIICMFLKKVEIFGFKSFANKTTLEFLPACHFQVGEKSESKNICGITSIVGPNGSGKSNVADAIRWVMGEQSMKNLRGKRSEDIIFAGSGKKSRLSSAWATLYFDNSDHRIPLEFEEVTITRKIFRNGEAEYLINGSKVRLLDITDLLAKAGIGRESYCVINQGMSDAVLNATPTDRRIVLEDAAGVKQYQIKKERSIRKLELTKENLKQIRNLMNEIEPHLRMLKRQADRAQKGKEIGGQLKEKQIKLFSFLWHTFQAEKEDNSSEKNDLGIKMMNIQREADKINDELSQESKKQEGTKKQDELEKKRQELQQKINVWERDLMITEGKIEIAKERLAQEEIIKSIPVDLKYVLAKLENIRKNQQDLIEKIQKAETLEELQNIRELAQSIHGELNGLYQDASKGKIEIKETFSKEQQDKEILIAGLSEKKEELEKNIRLMQAEIETVKSALEAEMQNEREMRRHFFELERELHRKQDEINKMKDQFNEAKIRLARVEVREEDLVNEIKNNLGMDVDSLRFDGEPVNRENLEKEIFKLKMLAEQIGGIDSLVMEEYEETKKRFEFMNKESADLEKAMESLDEVIKEMDEKIDEVFVKAFEKINQEFMKYFRIIFGGGNANLIKSKIKNRKLKIEKSEALEVDGISEDAVDEDKEDEREEIGIDIFVCPPGKKISHLSMLSGGERSLTSLALLFAIISFNPPPFAVLDEVEAALDEANSRRFGRILQELSGNTQFITITHNRETMRQASFLYGVTMGEDGISKLLSVRLDQVGQEGKIME